ncbi:unnamed protein product [Ranitomeya imitator]|uniref:Glutaredoxin domain-containing protein n=1 Tax=Ranitomeya imitator TaxID=111125 RepID=A0ABN9KZ80_9NEOB|nr:unnamed protein product [Ranitomeya imitator]
MEISPVEESHCEMGLHYVATSDTLTGGFSRQILDILSKHKIQFSSFDILSDEEVRQGLKTFSNWPTYPQLYINGELIGGLDIVKVSGGTSTRWRHEHQVASHCEKTPVISNCWSHPQEMEASGELQTMCPKAQSLEDRLKGLINKAPVILFMKGSKQMAKCGFSRQILEILNNSGVDYETFDILEDEEVRQGLKTFSNWPTYPQLYVKGELIGGLDIIKVAYVSIN